MDRVIDSGKCQNCFHSHFPEFMEMMPYDSRRDDCCEPECDCTEYIEPPFTSRLIHKCSRCTRMVERIWRSCWGGGQLCDECHGDD